MRNPPGRHLLRLSNRAVRSSSTSSGIGAGAGASTSAASPRTRAVAAGHPLRASSPPPPSAVAAAAYWDSRALRRDGEDGDWEEVVSGAPIPGEMEEEEEYRVVFWSPPTIDEVTDWIYLCVACLAMGVIVSTVFENHVGVDSDTTDRKTALLSTSGHSSGNSSGSDDWIEPAAYKMVMSLSCDKAVWNAVMNNEAVQDFRRSLHDGKENGRKGSTNGPAEVLKWILDSAQAKIVEFLENVMKIANMLIHPQDDDEKPDAYSDAVRVSFMLAVFVFIVVAIARIK
nr:unnamed protein product [Digitaria exilis]